MIELLVVIAIETGQDRLLPQQPQTAWHGHDHVRR
ncbi:MAG: hypothetical protein ACYSUB_05230 [Planctomycetota bacterium]